MKRPFAILMLSVCTALAIHAQGIVEWQANVARWQSAEWDCGRGETLRLMPSFLSGRNAIDLSGLGEAAFHWQTNGMGGLYWSVPARIDTNSRPHRLVADFEPWMDCGAAKYDYFFRAGATNGPVQYRAHGTIRMRGAPGETPNALPLPTPFIDFAKVAWTNAPWGEGGGVTIGDNQVTRMSDSGTIYWMFFDDEAIPIVDTDHLEVPYDNLTNKPDLAEKSDLARFVASTNLPSLSASSTVGDLVDAVNAVANALRPKEEP